MQLSNEKQKKLPVSKEKIKSMLLAKNEFITKLFSIVAFPPKNDEVVDEDIDDGISEKPRLEAKNSRAQSITELQARLALLKSKRTPQVYNEKLKRKNLKAQLKKKSKKEERSAQKKLERSQSLNQSKTEMPRKENDSPATIKPNHKPVYNSDGKMVFSKFDFSGLGSQRKEKKQTKDPKKILEKLSKQKERLEQLEASGEHEKVVEMKDKTAWRNAIAKAEGEKVKDDPLLLKKSMKKHEQAKKSSAKKWNKRNETVKQEIAQRVKKREENIDKRIKTKKTNKLKKAAKKGRIIAGF